MSAVVSTSDFEEVLERLSGDWMFIESFLNDPVKALSGYNLSEKERNCLVARDPEGLVALGVDEENVEIVLSGAHSQGCPYQPTVT
ncbi:MAG: hypothetical protein S4CHLAM123_15600 [Chlamydiales bacterium]|nr:hypothetical protein [Chlamydiales bacterium]